MIGIDSMKRDNVTSPVKSSVSSGCFIVHYIAFHEENSKSLILCASKMMNLEQQRRCSLTAKGKSLEMLLALNCPPVPTELSAFLLSRVKSDYLNFKLS